MSEQAMPTDIRGVAATLGSLLRLEVAELNSRAASVWTTPGVIEVVNGFIARAIFTERQKHDRPVSTDLQAEAERVFAEIDRLVQVKDVVSALAKALQAAVEAERKQCAKIAEGWEVTIDGADYQTCDFGGFWDAGNVYDQGRIDAAAAIRARS